MNVYQRQYPEVGAGGFTRIDGTIQFYARVNALLRPDMTVLEFGAGRGQAAEDSLPFRRDLLIIRGKVREVIGVDVDPVVLENPIIDRAMIFDGERLDLEDNSVDLILSDWVFEHLPHPAKSAAELNRVLKPGGWVCARTPYFLSTISIGGRLIPNGLHAKLLKKIQPGVRQAKDVFPTKYRLNSFRALKKYFPLDKWEHYSYVDSPAPSYHFGSRLILRIFSVIQYFKHPLAGEILLVFMKKK
jgi:SAM-dependent methyltransferase